MRNFLREIHQYLYVVLSKISLIKTCIVFPISLTLFLTVKDLEKDLSRKCRKWWSAGQSLLANPIFRKGRDYSKKFDLEIIFFLGGINRSMLLYRCKCELNQD